jgi:hypothetical protein
MYSEKPKHLTRCFFIGTLLRTYDLKIPAPASRNTERVLKYKRTGHYPRKVIGKQNCAMEVVRKKKRKTTVL